MSFCAKCGHTLEQSASFCTSCGAAAQSTSPVTQSGAAVQSAPAPEYTNYPPQGGKSSLLAVVVVGLVILISAAIAGAWYFRTHTGQAKVAANAADRFEGDLNLGSYPGAISIRVANPEGENILSSFLTHDTPDQVIGYYKVRFPVSETTRTENSAELSAVLAGGSNIRISAQSVSNGTEVKIVRE